MATVIITATKEEVRHSSIKSDKVPLYSQETAVWVQCETSSQRGITLTYQCNEVMSRTLRNQSYECNVCTLVILSEFNQS